MSWEEVEFEELYALPSKNGLTRPARVRGEGYKMINMGELFGHDRIGAINMELVPMNDKELETMLVDEGDLLFARQSLVLAGAGKCSIVKEVSEPTTFESHIIRVRLKKEMAQPSFFYYYFKSPICRIKSIVTQGVQAGIRGNDLKKLKVHLPPINVQKVIATTLLKYDELIENNRRRIQLLEESARLLYKEWFVHLRFPGHEHVRTVDGVPEGWTSLPLGETVVINPRTQVEKNKAIKYVPMSSLSETDMTVDTSDFEIREKHTNVKFRKEDTLVARITPCLENGKSSYVYFLEEDEVACGSTEFIVLRKKMLSSEYIYCMARSYDFREYAIKSMTGSSGRQRVQVSAFNEYFVSVPPENLLEQFNEFARGCFSQIKNLARQNLQLAEARDLLLPRLMNGEIAV
ncbi:MAG: restriction endonuclease subunit S [Gammaproteobacteria bacterium]|nr:restriction endonuclease subunit S [Gammaproteobacteria bacterium]MDH5653177.1 restriction endonuclease subunit S [Gammaproteobacteria bacterium]